jgi:hypothetical protein
MITKEYTDFKTYIRQSVYDFGLSDVYTEEVLSRLTNLIPLFDYYDIRLPEFKMDPDGEELIFRWKQNEVGFASMVFYTEDKHTVVYMEHKAHKLKFELDAETIEYDHIILLLLSRICERDKSNDH